MLQALADQSRIFRVPTNRANALYRVGKVQSELYQNLGREPSVEEIAEVRRALVADGERHVRHLLSGVTDERRRNAAVQMLSGVVLCPAVMYDELPDDELIAEAIDILLGGLGQA